MFWNWLKSFFIKPKSKPESKVIIYREVISDNGASAGSVNIDITESSDNGITTYTQPIPSKKSTTKNNTAGLVISSDGNMDMDIGGGLTFDPSDGSIGFNVGGFGIDLTD